VNTGCRTLWRAASLAASSALVAAVVGCGTSSPRLPRSEATPLLALAHRIAGEGSCAERRDIRRLRARAIAAVNTGRVPPPFQEPLLSGIGALVELTPACARGRGVPVTQMPPTIDAPHGDVAPVPHGATAAQEARNLAAWLERYAE